MRRIASELLWAVDISEPVDPIDNASGSRMRIIRSSCYVRCYLFDVNIVPRSKEHLACIERGLANAMAFLAQWD